MQKDNIGYLCGSRSYPRTIYVIFVFRMFCIIGKNRKSYRYVKLIEIFVIKHLETAVWNQYLRYADTLWSLVVLQDGCYDAWQGESRTVQGVAKLNLLVLCMAIAAVEAVSLIALEVGY